MPGTRRDIASLGNGWSQPMLWYARAVRALLTQPISMRTSWTALAALHGCDLPGWQSAGLIPPGALPGVRPEWNQCQHGNWFFLPWHRGYLASFEAIIAQTIVELGGPAGWTLPYWNYLDSTAVNARTMPQVFTLPTLPDGSANPLARWPRQYTVLAPHPPFISNDISLASTALHQFTSAQGALGFGGGPNAGGGMESNPHNLVHIMIGGVTGTVGYMSDPRYAALDPIFWLHHCNIDRLWAAWLTNSANTQENGAAWRAGPAVPQFLLPDPSGNLVSFTPAQTLPGNPLAPIYDDLTSGTGQSGAAIPAGVEDIVTASLSDKAPPPATLLGASIPPSAIAPGGAVTADLPVEADSTLAGLEENRLFLNIENIRGEAPSGMLDVRIGVKPAFAAEHAQQEYVDSLPLFGLKLASDVDGPHGGNGLNFVLDITDAVHLLARSAEVDPANLEVSLIQPDPGEGARQITVGRISVYRQKVDPA